MDLQRIESNGLSFQVATAGDGPAVLLLHGFPDSHRLWRAQVPALAGAGMRVIAPDLRGFGESDRPAEVEAYAFELLVADVLGIIDALGEQRVAVVGHDFGAFLAWTLAALVPDRFSKLGALAVGHPSAYRLTPIRQKELSWYVLLFQYAGLAEEAMSRDGFAFTRAMMGDVAGTDERIADLARPGALTAGLNWYRANTTVEWFAGLAPDRLPPVICPTLGVWADGDRYVTEEWLTESAAFVKGPWQYARLDGADHWFPYTAPDRCAELLVGFLTQPD